MFVDINVISTLAMHVKQSSSLQLSVFFLLHVNKKNRKEVNKSIMTIEYMYYI